MDGRRMGRAMRKEGGTLFVLLLLMMIWMFVCKDAVFRGAGGGCSEERDLERKTRRRVGNGQVVWLGFVAFRSSYFCLLCHRRHHCHDHAGWHDGTSMDRPQERGSDHVASNVLHISFVQ
ncbi:unnamed protein product [Anisakis simplex]|uniref:Secreted protein n=1 Tax=Anisakis simplex TaxID=6269 RepID=A0A0M3K2S7_ANISI|nr:unnamed protein product [Anisakis simplex]